MARGPARRSATHESAAPSRPGRARWRPDPLGLWLAGLAVLGFARAWLFLVRDPGSAGGLGWVWFWGSSLMGLAGLALLARGLAAHRRHGRD